MPNPKKRTLGAAAIIAAIALLGYGVFAVFTDTESSNVALDTGQLDLVGAEDIVITEMAPGDFAFRAMTLALPDDENDGDLVEYIDVSTDIIEDNVGDPTDNGDLDPDGEPAGESLLNVTDGIQVVFAVCDGGDWVTPAPNDPLAGTLTAGLDDSVDCDGGTVIAQAEQPLGTFTFTDTLDAAAFGESPTATGTIPDGSEMEVLLQFRLPTSANNAYENASVVLDIVFDAIQRAGVNR